jgi:hypothetical protein
MRRGSGSLSIGPRRSTTSHCFEAARIAPSPLWGEGWGEGPPRRTNLTDPLTNRPSQLKPKETRP